MRRYPREHLTAGKIEWIIKAKNQGSKNADIARVLSISERWVRRLYSLYRKTGAIPQPGKPGRPRSPITDEERKVVRDARERFGVGACYLEYVIKAHYGLSINHTRVYHVMSDEGLLFYKARTRVKRRKWVRYEREHSNSLWHVDWHVMKHPSYQGKELIVYEDDASRKIVGYGLFNEATSEHSVELLKNAIREHGRPDSIVDDRGSTFYAVEAEARVKGLTVFELYLMNHHIEQILAGVKHPQTNGKLEKLFDILENGLERGFFPMERCIEWYNCIRPHGSLDLERAETPVQAYYRKMKKVDELVDPSLLTREELIS